MYWLSLVLLKIQNSNVSFSLKQDAIIFSSIVTDPSVCGPQSPAIVDANYWTFQILNTNRSEFVFS